LKTVLLAAGMGLRIMPLTKDIPKCLIEVNGKTILERTVINCLLAGINDHVVVVGYKNEAVSLETSALASKYPVTFTLVENRDYQVTNTGVSLSFGLQHIQEDVIIINGDNIFDHELLKHLAKRMNTSLIIDNRKTLVAESFKVRLVNNTIDAMGKEIPLNVATGEFIGISLLRNKDLFTFKGILQELIKGNPKVYYDMAFQRLSCVSPLDFVFTEGLKWTEVDTRQDLEDAKKIASEIDPIPERPSG
jgi:choline kinase